MKFAKQLEAQRIPEWKEAYVNYCMLKRIIKKIKLSRPSTTNAVRDPVSIVTASLPSLQRRAHFQDAEQQDSELELIEHSREDESKIFLDKLDEELDKVNAFHESKEAEFVERGEMLEKQLQILVDLKLILERRRLGKTFSRRVSRIVFHESGTEPSAELVQQRKEMLEALERNGVTFTGTSRTKAKKGGVLKAAALRIDIPATTPRRTIAAMTTTIWEDIVNRSSSPGAKEGGDHITRKKLQRAEKMIRKAYVELYKGLTHLNNYSDLNLTAFKKIMKKFDKVTNGQKSNLYMSKVRRSQFVSSNKPAKLYDEVENKFTKHFANNDRKKAIKFLRLQQPNQSSLITFFVGLFSGGFLTLLPVYAILAHFSGVFSFTEDGRGGYMAIVYPIFSIFALFSLHIFLYGCDLYAWRETRTNHNFIFELNPANSLKPRDAFLIASILMTMVAGALVIHLLLLTVGASLRHFHHVPAILLGILVGLLICPLNICYRSTRFFFLSTIRKIVLSPLYKVTIVDFYLADQLCSQIPLMRHIEFTTCFFIVGGFHTASHDICTQSKHYKQVTYFISVIPYFWRSMQCLRRYMEEGYDFDQINNFFKNMSVLAAAAVRMKYKADQSLFWLAAVILVSSFATMYQLYWDYIKDWGFFRMNSKNRWLRDELILKNKTIYYVSIVLNFFLRLAWIQTVTHFNIGKVENRLVDFTTATLEITRRCIWNFFRLENEHLNNVGKFRVIKAVPLPFREMGSD